MECRIFILNAIYKIEFIIYNLLRYNTMKKILNLNNLYKNLFIQKHRLKNNREIQNENKNRYNYNSSSNINMLNNLHYFIEVKNVKKM